MKVAIITGASSGIGKVAAERLLKNGWRIYGLSRTEPNIKNGNFVWLACDLAKPDTIAKTLEKIAEPRVDLLVSNAGVAFEQPPTGATQESYEKMFSVNVLAPMLLTAMLKDKIAHSTIISISSVSDRLIEKDYALYCSSKAANTRFFEALADNLVGAKVYTLLPDYVDTPMLRELEEGRNFNWSQALSVEDLVKLVVDLALGKFDLASGSNIIVVNNALKEDLASREKLYGFNTDTGELVKLQ
ncbi:MAG: SDR family oxidoreductase [Candidatus Woykebacteria bacterium]